MTVYFEPQGKSWLDYAMPIVMQLLGSGMERTNQAKQYELQKRTAEEEMARKQQMAEYNANQVRDRWGRVSQPQPLSGLDQALNVAGYTPGAQQPAMERTPTLRTDPTAFVGAFNEIANFLPDEQIKANPQILSNLNAPMTFQQVNQGDRITAGPFDPGSGSFNGQSYDVGVDPSIADTNARNLEAQKIARDAQIRAAQINASRPPAPRAEAQTKLVPMQTDQGIVLLNPYTGEKIPTGLNPPAKGGSAADEYLNQLAGMDQGNSSSGGFLNWISSFFDGNGQAQAGAQIPTTPADSTGPTLPITDPTQDPEWGAQAAQAIANGWSPEEVMAWIEARRKKGK
jgi:hypothetical protein